MKIYFRFYWMSGLGLYLGTNLTRRYQSVFLMLPFCQLVLERTDDAIAQQLEQKMDDIQRSVTSDDVPPRA